MSLEMTKPQRMILSLIVWGVCLSLSGRVSAKDLVLNVDVRSRPPEMVVADHHYSGPLLDILEKAARGARYGIRYRKRQFEGSLLRLMDGDIDILPRTICTPERAKRIDYLGPIGYQKKEISFLVKKGREGSIQVFDDLKKVTVGVKRGTVYFKEFDNDNDIRRIESEDDENMVQMFASNRFDTMIILDKAAAEAALKKHHIADYAYARYTYPKMIGNYYGIARHHPAKQTLQKILEKMVRFGRVKEIYAHHGVAAPLFDASLGFEPCLPDK